MTVDVPITDGPPSVVPSGASSIRMRYYGGPVISNVKVIAVNWGPDVRPEIKDQVGGFYAAITDSEYMDWLSEYDTDITSVSGQPGTNQKIGRGTFGGQYTITPSVTSTLLQNADVAHELVAQITAGNLPEPDDNTLYMFDFPPGVVIQLGHSKTCNGGGGVCGFHNATQYNGKSIPYGVVPDFGGGNCMSYGCGGSGSLWEKSTSTHSHEVIEAVTDPDPLGARAWTQPGAGEVGDVCHYRTKLLGYNVQLEWSNQAHACILSRPTPPSTTTTP